MKENFYTNFNESAFQFVTDYLTRVSEAYTLYSGKLYSIQDDRYTGHNIYACPYQQTVYDSATNLQIPTGVNAGGTTVDRSDGLIFGFQNGRVFSEQSLGNVTGIFYGREVNFYQSNDSQEKLIFDTRYISNGSYKNFLTGRGAKPYDYTIPAVIFSSDDFGSEEFSLGGEKKTTFVCKLTVISDDRFVLDSVLGWATTMQNKCFPARSGNDLPLNEYGDLKTGYYNSLDKKGADFEVKKVYSRKIKDYATKSIPGAMSVGFIDLHIEKIHFFG